MPSTAGNTYALSDLIEEALSILYRVTERPLQVNVGTNDLTSSSTDTSFTLVESSVIQPPTPVEFGQELVLVTAKTEDPTPVLTAARGYAATPISAHAAGAVGLVAPQWPRFEVRRAILRAIRGPMNTHVPNITSAVYTPVADKNYIELPATVLRVLKVAITRFGATGGFQSWTELDQWDYVADVPASVAASGKLLAFAGGLASVDQELLVTHQVPYAWSGGTSNPPETDTLALPVGSEDLPALYAAAFLISRRELTRLEVDKIEEWSQEASIRQGVNMRALQQLWTEFYRRIDEVRRLEPQRRHRPFRKMSRR